MKIFDIKPVDFILFSIIPDSESVSPTDSDPKLPSSDGD